MSFSLPGAFGFGGEIAGGFGASRLNGIGDVEEHIMQIRRQIDNQNKAIDKFMSNNKDKEACCCGNVPPCRRNGRNVLIFKSTKKEAYETAIHWPGAKGVDCHFRNTHPGDKFPHYHPTYDPEGKKHIPGIHIQYPK